MDWFGNAQSDPQPYDFSFTVADESTIYRARDLTALTLPDLPTSATQKRGYDVTVLGAIAAIDQSANDILTKWIAVALDAVGDAQTVIARFRNNSQGLHRFDRQLAAKLMTTTNVNN